jgi:hypothetical protein
MDEDGQLDRVTQALGAIFPPDLNGAQRTTAAARPGSPAAEVTAAKPGEPVAAQRIGLSTEDRRLLDETRAAIDGFGKWRAEIEALYARHGWKF